MNANRSRYLTLALKIYTAAVLVTAAVLSPLALSAIPVLVLAWFIFIMRWPFSRRAVLMTQIFNYFALGLLFTPQLGDYLPVLIALPLIYGVDRELVDTAGTITWEDNGRDNTRRPTNITIGILSGAVAVLVVYSLTGILSLLLSSVLLIVYFIVLIIISLRRMPLRAVEPETVRHRMVAGATDIISIEMKSGTDTHGLLMLKSPYEWLSVSPEAVTMKGESVFMKLTVTPELSGPSEIKINVQAVDRRGLIRRSYTINPLGLFVIPRARYAAWLAEKYLSGTTQGSLPLISHMEARKPAYGLRRGIEYYGSQLYQPGDSLKNIDWKHSMKYDELITKEYAEFHGESAVMLVNLSVADEKEADVLAYNIIVTAVSLAQENIPAALAVYDHEDIRLITGTLHERQLIARCLQVAQEMVTFINPVKYLNAPDVNRLRSNINRIRSSDSQAVRVLSELLQIEYNNLKENSRTNPATRALAEVLARAGKQSSIVVISHRNHDAEALEFSTHNYKNRGNAVIDIPVA